MRLFSISETNTWMTKKIVWPSDVNICILLYSNAKLSGLVSKYYIFNFFQNFVKKSNFSWYSGIQCFYSFRFSSCWSWPINSNFCSPNATILAPSWSGLVCTVCCSWVSSRTSTRPSTPVSRNPPPINNLRAHIRTETRGHVCPFWTILCPNKMESTLMPRSTTISTTTATATARTTATWPTTIPRKNCLKKKLN